jgi:hypothetical protein
VKPMCGVELLLDVATAHGRGYHFSERVAQDYTPEK